MKKFASANFRAFLWIGIVVLLLVAARRFAAQSPAADSKKQAVHSAVASPIDPSQYVGEETCKTNKLRDLASPDVQKQSDEELSGIISGGKSKMPAYGKSLKPEQIKDLVTYIRTFKK